MPYNTCVITSTENCETSARQTKYCRSISQALARLGHATNAELLEALRRDYPTLSATTVHRATARLSARGTIATAPPSTDGSMRYDANTDMHDHFICLDCGHIRDAHISEKIIPLLCEEIQDCTISGSLVINGLCNSCKGEH